MDINTRFEECEIYTVSSLNSPNIYAGFTIQPLKFVYNQYQNKFKKYMKDEGRYYDLFEHFPNATFESQGYINVINHRQAKEELINFCKKYNYIPLLKHPRYLILSSTKKEEKARKYQRDYYAERSKKIINCNVCNKFVQLASFYMHKKSKLHLENLEDHELP